MLFNGSLKAKNKTKSPIASHNTSTLVSPTEKYITKVILHESPYLEKGVAVTKKYINPYYVDKKDVNQIKSIVLPELKSPYAEHRSKSSEPSSYQRKDNVSTILPSIKKNVSTYTPQYQKAKHQYMPSVSSSLYSSGSTRNEVYFYEIMSFNNGDLIRKLINNRPWWRDRYAFKTVTPPINFLWTIGNERFNYESLVPSTKGDATLNRCVNRFQNGFEMDDKDNLFRNAWHHHAGNFEKVNKWLPLTFSFRANELHFRRDLQQFCRFFLATMKGVALTEIKPISVAKDLKGDPYDVYYNLNNEFMTGNQSRTFSNFKGEEIIKNKCLFDKKNIWMLKPSGLNRGRGIELFTSLEELNDFLSMFAKGYDVTEYANMEYNDKDEVSPAIKGMLNKDKARTTPLVYKDADYNTRITNFVIQKYIERPMLFKKHKFDMRVFVVMTHERELYLFQDSYVRLSSLPYDADKKNYLIHLTNNAVQVRSDSFGNCAESNIISLRDVEEYIIELFKQTSDKKCDIQAGHFMKLIEEAVKVTFDSTERILHNKIRQYNFELFGYDFMIDEDLKLWLIEVNSVPSLDEDNSYLNKFMNRALDDMLRLTVDKIFPPPPSQASVLDKHLNMHPYSDDKTSYKFICKYPL